MLNPTDRTTLRDLAKQVAEIGAQPHQAERRQLWLDHNALRPGRPLVLCYPEGAWRELLPDETLTVTDPDYRGWEWHLRHLVYRWEHLRDDGVIEPALEVGLPWGLTSWGLEPAHIKSPGERGAWHYDPPIKDPADADRLVFPELVVDEAAQARRLAQAQELLGDILTVRPKKVGGFEWGPLHLGIVSQFAALRGLDQIMLDMVDRPAWVHRVMGHLTTGRERIFEELERRDLLALNNGANGIASGGTGYTDELPAPGFDGRVRTRDMWAFAEAQELALVSPAMHGEFVLQYQIRLLERFGLACYGCCEDLTRKYDLVFKCPRLRRISISPWADVDIAAERLGNRYVYSWKPKPSMMATAWDEPALRAYIRQTIAAAGRHGCVLEMVMKDTHTVNHEPWRLSEWVRIASEEVER